MSGVQPVAGAGGQRVPATFAGVRVRLPMGWERLLEPVEFLWARIGRGGARARVRTAVGQALTELAGVFGEVAPRLLRERLEARLASQGSAPILDPVGWMIGRGLRRRSACYDQRCDDGRRMDTGASCEACVLLVEDARALRALIARQVAQGLDPARVGELGRLTELRLHDVVQARAEAQVLARERAVRERERQAEAAAERRALVERGRLAAAQRPCADCGLERSGGLCSACGYQRAEDAAVDQAVLVTVAGLLDPTEASRIGPVAQRVRARVEGAVGAEQARLLAGGACDPVFVALARQFEAEAVLERSRQEALERLAASVEALEEAGRVRAAELARGVRAEAAERAAQRARGRAAEYLLGARLERLREGERSSGEVAEVGSWRERLAVLAERPLSSELVGAGAVVR